MNGKHIEARLTILGVDDAKDKIREKSETKQTLKRKRERIITSRLFWSLIKLREMNLRSLNSHSSRKTQIHRLTFYRIPAFYIGRGCSFLRPRTLLYDSFPPFKERRSNSWLWLTGVSYRCSAGNKYHKYMPNKCKQFEAGFQSQKGLLLLSSGS